jgi:tail tube protein
MATEGIYWFDDALNKITLEYSANTTSSPLDWTTAAELKGLSRNAAASDQIPFTHYGSTRKEFKLGLANDGTWDATFNFAPKNTTHAAIIALGESKAVRYWRITYPKAVSASTVRAQEIFTASVQTYGISPPGAEDTNPVDLNITLLGAGSYQFVPES